MATKKQLRIIARNIAARIVQQSSPEDTTGLTEKEVSFLHEELKKVSYSIVRQCHRCYNAYTSDDIIKDVLKNAK